MIPHNGSLHSSYISRLFALPLHNVCLLCYFADCFAGRKCVIYYARDEIIRVCSARIDFSRLLSFAIIQIKESLVIINVKLYVSSFSAKFLYVYTYRSSCYNFCFSDRWNWKLLIICVSNSCAKFSPETSLFSLLMLVEIVHSNPFSNFVRY